MKETAIKLKYFLIKFPRKNIFCTEHFHQPYNIVFFVVSYKGEKKF